MDNHKLHAVQYSLPLVVGLLGRTPLLLFASWPLHPQLPPAIHQESVHGWKYLRCHPITIHVHRGRGLIFPMGTQRDHADRLIIHITLWVLCIFNFHCKIYLLNQLLQLKSEPWKWDWLAHLAQLKYKHHLSITQHWEIGPYPDEWGVCQLRKSNRGRVDSKVAKHQLISLI